MPSIQQIIAEIQLAPDLPPAHIAKVINIIKQAEERLKLRGLNTKPRKAHGKGLMTIQEWEAKHASLSIVMMTDWMDENNLCYLAVGDMVEEFRAEMIAKGKQYANFKAAFITYLRKGYLSKRLDACTKEKSPYKSGTTVHSRGGVL